MADSTALRIADYASRQCARARDRRQKLPRLLVYRTDPRHEDLVLRQADRRDVSEA